MQKQILKFSILYFLTILLINSCIIVKEENKLEQQAIPEILLSPKPQIPMSEELIRSKDGDMIANIPENWFFVDVEEKVSSDIICFATNSDFSLGIAFSYIRSVPQVDEVFENEGLIGIARISFDNRQKKSAGAIKLVGDYNILQIGAFTFAHYDFINSNGLLASSAVFKSEENNYYEFSLLQMNITGKILPDKLETQKIFESVLTTIQY